jgi:hypothetical protein
MRPIYQALASKVEARRNCTAQKNEEWFVRHTEDIEALVKNWLPSGGGFDAGVKLDFDKSSGQRLVFQTAFHHMDDNGSYDRWTDHTVTVRPDLCFGMTLTVSGRDYRDIKEYVAETFENCLRSPEPAPVEEAARA